MITLLLKKLDGTTESRLVEGDHKLSPHFTAKEFLVNRNDGLHLACVSEYDLDTLEYIRTILGLSVNINSAGRTPEYNAKIDGAAKDSCHQYLFDCMDIVIPKATAKQLDNVYVFLRYRGYTGIGRYKKGRFHIDIGYRDKLKEWDKR